MRNMKFTRFAVFAMLFLFCIGIFGRTQVIAETTAQENDTNTITANFTGWVEKKGKQYYYSSGKMVTGWRKISGKQYYFSKSGKQKGELIKNTIAGTQKEGYYYVDSAGVRATSGEIKTAVKFVTDNTKTDWSKSKKLKKSFEALCKKGQYERAYDNPSLSKMPKYAKYMLSKMKGNCYRHAAGIACIARVLGYDSRVALRSGHGWAEVKMNGKWYRFDATYWRLNPSSQYYKAPVNSNKKNYKASARYKLIVKNGKAIWK